MYQSGAWPGGWGAALGRHSLHSTRRAGGGPRGGPGGAHQSSWPLLRLACGLGQPRASAHSVRAATAEQQALEHVRLARVLRLSCRRKAAGGGVGRYARTAILQLSGRAQPMQHVHHLQAGLAVESSVGRHGRDFGWPRGRHAGCTLNSTRWPASQATPLPEPALHTASDGCAQQAASAGNPRTSSPALARSPPPPMRKPCSSSSPAPGACTRRGGRSGSMGARLACAAQALL